MNLKKWILGAAALWAACAVQARQVRGLVYLEDASAKDRGVPGAVVSDGYNVVTTDKDGRFRLELDPKSKFVFVTTPSGTAHTTPFYRRADEKGDFRFGLKARKEGTGRFIHISDTEATIGKDWVDDLRDYIRNHPVDFMVFSGDICYEKGIRFHRDHITDESMGTRMVYTLGNHDLMKRTGDYPEQLFEDSFGPVWYSFDVNGVHFVTLPVTYGDKEPKYGTDDMYRWLRKDLEAQPREKPVVVFCHFLLGHKDDFVLKSAGETLNLLDYNLKGWFYGHWHNNMYERSSRTGVETFSTMSPNKGGIDHSPSSFRVVEYAPEGRLKSALVWAKVRNHLSVNAWEEGGGKLGIAAGAYDCTVAVDSVVLVVKSEAGERVRPMERVNDWVWETSLPRPAEGTSLEVRARFANGDRLTKAVRREPRIRWVSSLNTHILMASPLVEGTAVYTAGTNDAGEGSKGLYALDARTGEPLWHCGTKNSVKNNIAYEGGTVLACDAEGIVYGADALTGKLKWSHALDRSNLQPYYSQGICARDGRVYAGQGVSLAALDTETGEPVWKNRAWKGGVVSAPTPVLAGRVLLASAYWTGRFAHDALTGGLLWQKRDNETRNCDGSPTVHDGKFFYTSSHCLFEVDPETGEELKRVKLPYDLYAVSRPVVTDSLVIFGTADKGVVALDRTADYKQLWNFRTAPALFYTAPYTKDFQQTVESGCALHRGRVYFGTNDGYLYCLEAATGRFLWRLDTGAPVLSNVVVKGDRLYLNNFSGQVFCIDIAG